MHGYLLDAQNRNADALKAFQNADRLNPRNREIMWGIVISYMKLGMLKEMTAAQLAFAKVFPTDKRGQASLLSVRDQAAFIMSKDSNSTKAFLATAFYQADKANFNKREILVFINDFNDATRTWNPQPDKSFDHTLVVEQAFYDWTSAARHAFHFKFTGNEKEADITVDWVPGSAGLVHSMAVGQTSVSRTAYGQTKCAIKLLVSNKKTADAKKYFYTTTAHEIGHALGLSHSEDIHDIMYFSELGEVGPETLSARDEQRIMDLYKR
jgi:hypothetical protein